MNGAVDDLAEVAKLQSEMIQSAQARLTDSMRIARDEFQQQMDAIQWPSGKPEPRKSPGRKPAEPATDDDAPPLGKYLVNLADVLRTVGDQLETLATHSSKSKPAQQ